MQEAVEHLPEEHFEVKKGNLYYHPPDNAEEFLMHYELFWPVRLFVEEALEVEGIEPSRPAILGCWVETTGTVKFVPSDFKEGVF